MNPPGLPPAPPPRRRWEIPFFTALLAATLWAACFCFPETWKLSGIAQGDKPFLDLRNLLAAAESAQLGYDPYVKNPLDPYNRPHGYSGWWLLLGDLGIDQSDTAWIGGLLLLLTLGASVWLVRPASVHDGARLLLVLVSPPLLMAVQRANHDLVVFVLMGVALVGFRSPTGPARALGVVLLAIAAVLKYFPLAAVILLLEARSRRELVRWTGLYGLVLVLAWPALERGFHTAVAHKPAPDWLYAFGAPVMFRNFNLPSATALGWMLAVGLFVAVAGLAWRSRPWPGGAWAGREFACGAVMIVGCFLHGSSFVYKLIFAVWMLPELWHGDGDQRWRKVTWLLLLAVLWFEGAIALLLNLGLVAAVFSPAAELPVLGAGLVIEQLLTWALIGCLWRGLVIYLGRAGARLAAAPR